MTPEPGLASALPELPPYPLCQAFPARCPPTISCSRLIGLPRSYPCLRLALHTAVTLPKCQSEPAPIVRFLPIPFATGAWPRLTTSDAESLDLRYQACLCLTDAVTMSPTASSGTLLSAIVALVLSHRRFHSLERRLEVIDQDLKQLFTMAAGDRRLDLMKADDLERRSSPWRAEPLGQ
jgi:hypothetical protein